MLGKCFSAGQNAAQSSLTQNSQVSDPAAMKRAFESLGLPYNNPNAAAAPHTNPQLPMSNDGELLSFRISVQQCFLLPYAPL